MIAQTKEMELRAEMRRKPTHELYRLLELGSDVNSTEKIAAIMEALWERGKLNK